MSQNIIKQQIYFLVRSVLRITIFAFLNIFIKRDKKILLFGCRKSRKTDMFTFNTKYLYLEQQRISDLKLIWLSDDDEIINGLKSCGYKNIYKRNSAKGFYYSLKAGFWITDNDVEGVNNSILSSNALLVNVWHGVPLKKIENDIEGRFSYPKIINKIYRFLKKKEDYLIACGDFDQECFATAFLTDKNKIKILGSPRLDAILNNINYSDVFMEKDFNYIKQFKEQGKKIIIYMPTFRDTGKNISGWLKSDNLNKFLKENNIILLCKLHFNDIASLESITSNEIYIMDNNSDVYPILKYSDALITDYSSIYFDYLLLDKPILYFPFDMEEYKEQCRGFYRPYEKLTSGIKVFNEKELISAMQDVVNGIDNYKEERNILRNKIFKNQDGQNCKRFFDWIRSFS